MFDFLKLISISLMQAQNIETNLKIFKRSIANNCAAI